MINFALGFLAACALAIVFPSAFRVVLDKVEAVWEWLGSKVG